MTVTGSGQADFRNDSVALSVDVPGGVAKLIPGGSATPEVINVVETGGTVYLEVPNLASMVGKPWISVALPAKAKTTGKGALSKVAGALGDVSAIAQFAQSHNASVTPLKGEVVNGVPSTGTQIVAKLSHNGGSSTVTATLWADSSDRLVQANVAASGALKAGTVGVNADRQLHRLRRPRDDHGPAGLRGKGHFAVYGGGVPREVPPWRSSACRSSAWRSSPVAASPSSAARSAGTVSRITIFGGAVVDVVAGDQDQHPRHQQGQALPEALVPVGRMVPDRQQHQHAAEQDDGPPRRLDDYAQDPPGLVPQPHLFVSGHAMATVYT